MEINKIYCMDAIEFMKQVSDKSVDMILVDLPYGTTACSWDEIILFEPMWKEMLRISKDNCAMVFTASQPFTTKLINSNFDLFRYSLVWDKIRTSGGLLANKMPLRCHEDIIVFYKKLPIYNPQMTIGEPYNKSKYNGKRMEENIREGYISQRKKNNGTRFPKSILTFSQNWKRQDQLHPTQKPVSLFEYLIKTYTNEGALVMDCCVGSGTTAVACKNINRNFICNDNNQDYVKIANERLIQPLHLFQNSKCEGLQSD